MPLDNSASNRLPLVPRRQQALHNQLIGSMTGGGEECAADQSCPECVRLPEVWREVEDPKLARAFSHAVNGRPSARHQMQDREQSH